MGNPQASVRIAGHPLHPMLVPFPIAFFVGTLAADIAYAAHGDMFWFRASLWLVGAGVVMALVAALAGFTDLLGDARIRELRIAWVHFLGNLIVVLIEAANWYRRHAIGPDAVRPTGLWLSIVAVLILLVTGWLGWEMVYRRRVAVADEIA